MDGIIACLCPFMLLAENNFVCYWVNDYIYVMFVCVDMI